MILLNCWKVLYKIKIKCGIKLFEIKINFKLFEMTMVLPAESDRWEVRGHRGESQVGLTTIRKLQFDLKSKKKEWKINLPWNRKKNEKWNRFGLKANKIMKNEINWNKKNVHWIKLNDDWWKNSIKHEPRYNVFQHQRPSNKDLQKSSSLSPLGFNYWLFDDCLNTFIVQKFGFNLKIYLFSES